MSNINIFELLYPKYKITKPIRLIELFAGIGSQAKALKNINANFETYKVVEFDKYAISSYNAIHNTNFKPLDITKINGKDLEIIDTNNYTYLLTYSFPCQDLSCQGKGKGMKKGSNTRSGLLWQVERLLTETNELPQILLMENVTQVHSKENIDYFKDWILFLEKLGYSNYWQDLNSKDYEMPQNRNRTFMVSILGDYYYEFPKKQKLTKTIKDLLDDEVEEKYYISSKQLNGMKKTNFNSYSYDTNLIDVNDISPCIIAGYQRAPHFIMRNGRECVFTPKECFRFMGFNDIDFEKAKQINSDTQLYKQAGNSIVVKVLEEIFKKLL